MQLTAPVVGSGGNGGSFAIADLSELLERQQLAMADRDEKHELRAEKALHELKAEMERQRKDAHAVQAEMAAQIEGLREDARRAADRHPLADVLSEEQLAALQVRLQSLHEGQLLTDEENFTVEDIIADCVEVMAAGSYVGGAVVAEVVKIVALSERIHADGSFARQLRRKCR